MKSRINIFFVLILLLIAFSAQSQTAGSLHFVYAAPGMWIHGGQSHPMRIYSLNEQTNTISLNWEMTDTSSFVDQVHVFPVHNFIAISSNKENQKYLKLLNATTKKPLADILLGPMLIVTNHKLMVDQNGDLIVVNSIVDKSVQKGYKSEQMQVKQNFYQQSTVTGRKELLLGGQAPPYGSVSHDIVTVKIGLDGIIIPISAELDLGASPIPKDLYNSYGIDTSSFWVLVANESSYRILASTSNAELLERNIRIYLFNDKVSNTWGLLEIEGSATRLRSTGRLLSGVVTTKHPDTDIEKRFTKTPIWTDKVVLVDPLGLDQFTVQLGEGCEVLWVEGSTVFYRVGSSLFKANISGDDFVNRIKLFEDPIVRQFHWAYRSKN